MMRASNWWALPDFAGPQIFRNGSCAKLQKVFAEQRFSLRGQPNAFRVRLRRILRP